MERVIGIDFGTSTTYMAVKRYQGTEPDGDRSSYIPIMFNYGQSSGYVATIVRENADGSFDFGEKAGEPLEGAKIHTEIKMHLESANQAEREEAQRITRRFFQYLHETYTQQAGDLGAADDQEETVISYPVKWREDTAQFMLDAAREAGFQNVRGMDEAEAAVAAVLCQDSSGRGLIYADEPGYLLLIDMGAGTTDLVVCKYQAKDCGLAIELVTSWPQSSDEPTFGGREIDAVLSGYVEDHLKKALPSTFHQLAHDMANAPGSAKKWKELTVSPALAAGKRVTTCGYLDAIRSMLTEPFSGFGREEFEDLARSGLQDYVRLVQGCLEQARQMDPDFSRLDLVILTGGHSSWYFAREILTGTMEGWLDDPALARVRENPYRVVSLPNPQTTVSRGLVYSRLPYKLGKQEPAARQVRDGESAGTADDTGHDPSNALHEHLRQQAAETGTDHMRPNPADGAKADGRDTAQEEIFAMKIDGVFEITGQDAVAAGVISSGTVAVGAPVEVRDRDRLVLSTIVKEIVLGQEQLSRAGKGDSVGILLPGANKRTVRAGMTLTAPEARRSARRAQAEGPSKGRDTAHQDGPDRDSGLEEQSSGASLDHIRKMTEQGYEDAKKAAKHLGENISSLGGSIQDKRRKTEKQLAPELPYRPIDRTKCQNCGTAIPEGAKKCPVCGRKARKVPVTPFKLDFVSWFVGEVKLGVAKATGTLTICDDRVEFKRVMGNTAAVLTPYTLIYSLGKSLKTPRDIYWIKDVRDARAKKTALGVPCLILTMRTGEVYTFSAQFNTQAAQEAIEDSVELIQRHIFR